MKIELTNLSKQFNSGSLKVQALDNVSFVIEPGEILGFVGANGAGKSTTMRILMGVLNADQGEVLLDGVPANTDLRQKIGYMPSERGLYPKMEVKEQIVFFAKIHGMTTAQARESASYWLKKLDIEQHAKKQLSSLSTGNQQRVQLAAALVSNPEALVLDEPFSGLDPIAVEVMSDVIREFANKGAPVLFSSHQLELVDEISDKVAIIKRGRILHIGTPAELRREVNAPETITIPTPLSQIFGGLIQESASVEVQNA
ncbi:MAG: ATP-binding cassette domain-containing protein [Candidatus Ancillula sp.]|jgi:ABC-2 type transport system ATP-binding protein|nr:ATP-binding cassette domain-containing protein [Candidatus Ancillula sp.]